MFSDAFEIKSYFTFRIFLNIQIFMVARVYVYIYAYVCIYIYTNIYTHIIFTNPSAQAGYNTRSIFKRSLTGLNSEFSFS